MDVAMFSPRQIVVDTILILLLIYAYANNEKEIYVLLIYLLIFCLGQTFLPFIKSKLNYSKPLQQILFDIPLLLPIITLQNSIYDLFITNTDYKKFVFLITGSSIIFMINKKAILNTLTSFITKFPITYINCTKNLVLTLFSISSEEIFFRGFLFIKVSDMTSISIGIIVSSIIFVLLHYTNRWAYKIFKRKSYIMQFALALLLNSFIAMGGNIIWCILVHFLYDIQIWGPSIIRLKNKRRNII